MANTWPRSSRDSSLDEFAAREELSPDQARRSFMVDRLFDNGFGPKIPGLGPREIFFLSKQAVDEGKPPSDREPSLSKSSGELMLKNRDQSGE
jgi:hypothetical protein